MLCRLRGDYLRTSQAVGLPRLSLRVSYVRRHILSVSQTQIQIERDHEVAVVLLLLHRARIGSC